MLSKPKTIHRTTFDQAFDGIIPYVGVYVIAYMGKVIYIGKAEESITGRLTYHVQANKSLIGIWLNYMEFDWPNIRLDILEPPDDEDMKWIADVEFACIRKFSPLFNDQLMVELPSLFKNARQLMFDEVKP